MKPSVKPALDCRTSTTVPGRHCHSRPGGQSRLRRQPLADGIDVTGTNLFAPNYVTPRSVQMNFGIQHEIRRGMVFTADYLRNISTHTLLTMDTNHVGAARYLNTDQRYDCYYCHQCFLWLWPGHRLGLIAQSLRGRRLATMQPLVSILPMLFALDSPVPSVGEPGAAFPGINQTLGPIRCCSRLDARFTTDCSFLSSKIRRTRFRGIRYLNLEVSYSLSRYDSTARDSDFINFATDNDNPLKYVGPNGLDRTNQLSFGGTMDLPKSFRVSLIGHFLQPASCESHPESNRECGRDFCDRCYRRRNGRRDRRFQWRSR